MKPYRYLGPHDALDVAGLGVVALGETLQVPLELAAEFDARPDFEHVPDKKKG